MVLASVFQVSLTSRLLPSHQVISKTVTQMMKCCSIMTLTCSTKTFTRMMVFDGLNQVQAVKLNIGVTVTANLAIFLFLVQVNNKQKS